MSFSVREPADSRSVATFIKLSSNWPHSQLLSREDAPMALPKFPQRSQVQQTGRVLPHHLCLIGGGKACQRFFHSRDALRPRRIVMRIVGAEQDALRTPASDRFADQRVFRLYRPMEMFKVIEWMLFWAIQMRLRSLEHFSEFLTLFEAVEQVKRVADVAFFQDELEIGKAVEHPAVDNPRDRDHVLERMSQHPPDNRIVGLLRRGSKNTCGAI